MRNIFLALAVVVLATVASIAHLPVARSETVCTEDYTLSYNVNYLKTNKIEYSELKGNKAKEFIKYVVGAGSMDVDKFMTNIPDDVTILSFMFRPDTYAFISYDKQGCTIRFGNVLGYPGSVNKAALVKAEGEDV